MYIDERRDKAIVTTKGVERVRKALEAIVEADDLGERRLGEDVELCSADDVKSVARDALARLDEGKPHASLAPYWTYWTEFKLTGGDGLCELADVVSDVIGMMYPDLDELSEHDIYPYSTELVDAEYILRGRMIANDDDTFLMIPDEYWPNVLNPNI